MKHIIFILLLVFSSISQGKSSKSIDCETSEVLITSLMRIVSSPKAFKYKCVQFYGYVMFAHESNHVFYRHEDFSFYDTSNAIRIEATEEQMLKYAELNGEKVLVRGYIDVANLEREPAFHTALLKNIKITFR